ncbi:10861_t:CDS:2, partial [Dentiscutata heterogama]
MIAKVIPSINSSVDSSTTNISVYFYSPVYLSTGNITIYKASDQKIRQTVSATSEFCKLSDNGSVVYINIVNSTFNEYGEKYYVKMDNNFAKDKYYNEPLRGIESDVWLIESVYRVPPSETAAKGLAVLTIDASKKFLALSRTNQSAYFDKLLDELVYKIPVRRERLSSDEKFQNFDEFGQIVISIRIDLPINENENTVPGVFSNLNSMILHKNITIFSAGVTNDLNSTLGFRPVESLWDQFKSQIIGAIAIYTVYNGRIKYSDFKEWVNRRRELVAVFIILAVTDHEYLTILKDAPRFIEVAIDYKYLTIMKDDPESEKAKTDYEYLKVLKDELKSDEINQIKKIYMFRQIFKFAIIYGALFDIFRNILQIVIQVRIHYYNLF